MQGKGTIMRYYLPTREKRVKEEGSASAFILPLWVWVILLACLLVFALSLR